jgi:hypothetical protein
MSKEPRLLGRVRAVIRTKGYSIHTEQAYVDWVRRFILSHNKRHPDEMGKREVEAFLTHLVVKKGCASFSAESGSKALLFLYRVVLDRKQPLVRRCHAGEKAESSAGGFHR